MLTSSSPSWHWRLHWFVLSDLLFCAPVICWVADRNIRHMVAVQKRTAGLFYNPAQHFIFKCQFTQMTKTFSRFIICFYLFILRHLPLTYQPPAICFYRIACLSQAMACCTHELLHCALPVRDICANLGPGSGCDDLGLWSLSSLWITRLTERFLKLLVDF